MKWPAVKLSPFWLCAAVVALLGLAAPASAASVSPMRTTPPAASPGMKFIAGEPMKPATNSLTGRS